MISKTYLRVDDIGMINIFLPPILVVTPPIVTVRLTKGSSSVENQGKIILLDGDEKNFMSIPPVVAYFFPPYVQPGILELAEIILDSSNYSSYTTENGKKFLIGGSAPFTAKFKVKMKAAIPPAPPVKPDPTFDMNSEYMAKEKFIPSGINFHET